MQWYDWIIYSMLIMFYIMCLFTVCGLTFQKGRTVLGIVGIFIPFLWLIGAILPAKPGSRYDVATRQMAQSQMQSYTA